MPGWAKVDGCDGSDLFRQHRTVARVRWIFDGGKIVEQAFNAAPDLQVMPVDVVTKNVTVQILATNAAQRHQHDGDLRGAPDRGCRRP